MNVGLMTYLAIGLIGLGISIQRHGTQKIGKYNAWEDIIAYCISVSLVLLAVYG